MLDVSIIFRNPLLSLQAGICLGMGIGCLITVFFLTRVDEDDDSDERQ